MSNIIYTWDCRTVDCYPTKDEQGVELDDVVYNIHWRLTGTEVVDTKTYSATVIGTQMVSADDIDPDTFVPFNELTNEIATGWCTAAMGAEQVANLETSVANQIASQINPTSITLVIGQPVPPTPVVEEPAAEEGEQE
jgi:hypothetical protein